MYLSNTFTNICSFLLYFFFFATTHTVAPVTVHTLYLSLAHLVPTFGLWFQLAISSWVYGFLDGVNQRLVSSWSSLLSERVQSMKIWLQGITACLKWKWVLLLPLQAITNTHNGNSPLNLSVNQFQMNTFYFRYFFAKGSHLYMDQRLLRGCRKCVTVMFECKLGPGRST